MLKLQDVISATKPNLSDAESQDLKELLTDRMHHRTETGKALPIRQPTRRLPLPKQAVAGEMLKDMQR
jgi:hypothetical protein